MIGGIVRHLYSFRSRQIPINGQQTLGVALPLAIAATLVRPSEKVLSISGDGGFLFSSMELRASKLNRISLKTGFSPSSTHRTFWPRELAQNVTFRKHLTTRDLGASQSPESLD
ncbi:thiamine pyrophosphate-dependent enzyme [Tunturiibacter gelidoferens]|uniref:thiamine pyrophosphate-dependent enzyme n=1 Tax=Tunturiibacter gelidiferens TaxID=3069689 RepID=UPI001FE7141B|nr:thiamine pyrophosphate-dependent enzyme [Edaphobacter lichenicola]